MRPFQSFSSLVRHLVIHVLTPPESHGWFEIWGRSTNVLSPNEAGHQECFHLRQQLAQSINGLPDGSQIELLFTLYVNSINGQILESQQLGWQVSQHGCVVGLDTNGIVVVRQCPDGLPETVSTAFLPGFGSAEATRNSQKNPNAPHARVVSSAMRHRGNRGKHTCRNNGIQERLRSRYADHWGPDERVYYLVFRPVIQYIKSQQLDTNAGSQVSWRELKKCLPPNSQLKLKDWQSLRLGSNVSNERTRPK